MKIQRIRFQNINSLRGEHTIDFNSDPLKTAGLFAITGPTGSGKSTLLDVICLALFNKVPRMHGAISRTVIEKTGSIITRNTKEAFAEVEYQCSQGNFRSRWEISTARTGKLRDYHMEVTDLLKGKVLDTKRSEVPAANEEQIGLNYDQFVKSIMLAQGDFAKFLQANKSDRSALLEKITGTSMYRHLGMKAFEMNRLHNTELAGIRSKQQVFKDQLLTDEDLAVRVDRQTSLAAEKQANTTRIKEFEKHIENHKAYTKIQADIYELSSKEEDHQRRKSAFDAAEGKRLQQHNSLTPEASLLRSWQKEEALLLEYRKELLELKQQLQTNASQAEQKRKSTEDLLKTTLGGKDLLAHLEAFQKDVQELQRQRESIAGAYGEALAETKHLKKWNVAIDNSRFEISINNFKAVLSETNTEVDTLGEHLEATDKENLEAALTKCAQQIQSSLQANELAKNIASQQLRLGSLEVEKTQLSKRLKELPITISKAKEKCGLLQKEKDFLSLKLENQKLRASLDSHRTHLEEGTPCPLCGALEHPFAEAVPDVHLELENDLKKAEESLRECELMTLKLEQELKSLSLELEKNTRTFTNEQSVLKEQEMKLRSYQKHFSPEQLALSWGQLEQQLQEKKGRLEQFLASSEKLAALKETEEAVEKLESLFRRGKEKAAAIKSMYSGADIVHDVRMLREAWIALKQNEKVLLDRERDVNADEEKHAKEVKALSEALLPALETKGFRSIKQALEVRLPEEEQQQLQSQLQNLQEDGKLLSQALKDKREALSEKLTQLEGVDALSLQSELQEAKNKDIEINQQLEEVNRLLKNHAECLERVETLQKTINVKEQTGKKWELLNQYIGDSTGKKFNDFAQDLTLSQLVHLANRRLSQLNDRYKLDRSRKEEDDSLMVLDAHMGNERRSVKTLSGGETFILSLSLALALSDLASRNVEINSLFIDEGFGTLDPEVLDQTLDTLERLQSEGSKTIGIISHVEALKERITTKIQLIRNGQGYSSLKVVAQ